MHQKEEEDVEGYAIHFGTGKELGLLPCCTTTIQQYSRTDCKPPVYIMPEHCTAISRHFAKILS